MYFAYITSEHVVITTRRLTSEELIQILPDRQCTMIITFGDNFDRRSLSCWRNCLVVEGKCYIIDMLQLMNNSVKYAQCSEIPWEEQDILYLVEERRFIGMGTASAQSSRIVGSVMAGATVQPDGKLSVIFGDTFTPKITYATGVFMHKGRPLVALKCTEMYHPPPDPGCIVRDIPIPDHSPVDVIFTNSRHIVVLFEDQSIVVLFRCFDDKDETLFKYSKVVRIECGMIHGIGVNSSLTNISVISGDRYMECDASNSNVMLEIDGVVDTSFTEMTRKTWIPVERANR